MSASDRWTIPPAVQAARIVMACSDLAEFERDFLPRFRTQGIFVATRHTPRVGDRIHVKVELLDNSIGYAGEAVVAALDREGSCPGIRALLDPPPSGAQVAEPSVAQSEIETIRVSTADLESESPEVEPEVEIETEVVPIQVSAIDLDSVFLEVEPEAEIETEVLPVADDPLMAPVSWLGGEQTMRRQPHLAEWFEVLAAGALRTGDLEAAEAHCQLGIQADPERVSLRTLLHGIEAQRRAGVDVGFAHS